MVAGGGARVVFADREVAALTGLPSGQVYRYMVTTGRAIARDARQNAPKRTGELSRSISARITRANATSTYVRIVARAPHAAYVHQGTAGASGKLMWLYAGVVFPKAKDYPRDGMSALGWFGTVGKPVLSGEVAGQTANPFIAQALGEWCMENGFKHPMIRGPVIV